MKLYVGNLPYRMTEDELRDPFEAYGTVASVNIVYDKETGRSKGFGFVDMPNESEAEEALEQLNGSPVGGRPLRIDKAQPRSDKPRFR